MPLTPDPHPDDPWALPPEQIAPSAAGPAPTALHVEIIENVAPLDSQIGVWPKKTVPDTLYETIFGQPEPTGPEIKAAGGDPAAVPPMQTYAILDAAKVAGLPELLESSGLAHRCLFKGDTYDELRDVAPWIVRLEEGNGFTRSLFTRSDAPWHLWDAEPGIFVRSRTTLDDMWRHFRKYTRVQDENGKWYYFRFWEGSVFSAYWKHFRFSHPHVERFFHSGNIGQSCQICFINNNTLTYVVPIADLRENRPAGISALPFSADDRAFFQFHADERLKDNVRTRLRESLKDTPEDKRAIIPDTVDGAFGYIRERSRGALISADDCFTLSLLALLWGDVAGQILRGPLLNEPLLSIGQRIALAKASYLETLKKLQDRKA